MSKLSERQQWTFVSRSPQETKQVGRLIGQELSDLRSGWTTPGAIVLALQGQLGAGKTTLTQGVAAGLGIADRVTSPTFTLMREYAAGNLHLAHVDSYRLGEEAVSAAGAEDAVLEAATFGLEELLDEDGTVVIIEWAERLESIMPPERLQIDLDYTTLADATETRTLTLTAHGGTFVTLLEKVAAVSSAHDPDALS